MAVASRASSSASSNCLTMSRAVSFSQRSRLRSKREEIISAAT
ncbi:hypothetical protein [Roseomonas mucosa]